MREIRETSRQVAEYATLGIAALLVVVPLAFTVITALSTPADFATRPAFALPTTLTLQNFGTVLFGPADLGRAMIVTAMTIAVLVTVQVPCAILAAYAFAVGTFRGRDALFALYLIGMLVPGTLLVVPLFVMIAAAGLADTFWALVLPFVLASPFAVFLLRQHFRAVPTELLDAARLDGATELQIVRRVVLPLSRPVVATVIFVTVVTQWNAFLWPRVAAGAEWATVTVATAGLRSQYDDNWTLVMAATTLALLPMIALFLLVQRRLTPTLVPGIEG
jgi:multiple sugar transport system permease protein